MARRPSTSASVRPPSVASSIRPSTSTGMRPSSSASSVRPATSASIRPSSRATTASGSSRLTRRPSSRQISRLTPLYQSLVSQVTGVTAEEDEEGFRSAVEYISKSLDQTVKPSGTSDLTNIDKHIRGLSQKARILSQDELAEALDSAYSRLKTCIQEQTSDLDAEIHTSRLSHHLQFLLALSRPPDFSTLAYAENYLELQRNPPKSDAGLTWKDILAEEPFEGQHWQGAYGLPPGSTVENWEDEESDSSLLSLSALDDLDDLDDEISSSEVEDRDVGTHERREEPQFKPSWDHLDIVEALQARQYWRPEWQLNVPTDRPFDFGDPSTLGPAFRRALSAQKDHVVGELAQEKYINDHDAMREILMGLQGRRNLMISWTSIGNEPFTFQPAKDAPRLLHLTSGSLDSLLASYAQTATTVEHLRKFVSAIFAKASKPESSNGETPSLSPFHRRSTRTLEALSESIDAQIRAFDTWCAAKEEAICRAQAGIGPPLVISMLALEVEIRDKFSSIFSVLVRILSQVVQRATRSQEPITEVWTLPDLPLRMSPSALTSLLLDSLLLAVQESSTMADDTTTQALLRIFCDSAEPIWTMVGRWLRDGMPVREVMGASEQYLQTVDEEFFIEDNELVLLDPDFWSDGFVLRNNGQEDNGRSMAVPLFLSHASDHILGAGKAIGLLRALGMSSVFEREGGERWLSKWPSFTSLLGGYNGLALDSQAAGTVKVHISTDDFSRLVYDELLVPCMRAKEMLTKILVEDCELWLHLTAMEDLYLMRRGDAMSNFVDILFARMDTSQPWNDFHFLNSAFRDVVEAGRTPWIDPSLVRFSHRGGRDKIISRTVRAIDGLSVEYAVPFPLTYMFGPRILQVYSSIFAFVLQIRRAQNALQRILLRNAVVNMAHVGSELKVFYAMRGKLSWFVNALLNFICTNVLHAQLLNFNADLKKANSLDEMIAVHDTHITKLEGRCLLQRNTSALHRAVISILDMCLHFSDCFVAFAGDTTHDISRQSLILMKRHRSRRLKRQRKDVIGFSQSIREVEENSDSDSDQEEFSIDGGGPEPSFSLAISTVSFAEESFDVRLEKMSSELDALVRFIRRGVESLAGGTGEAASAFGVFAFALEDWDR
ncbi:unnamed protein product [Somion occarium]